MALAYGPEIRQLVRWLQSRVRSGHGLTFADEEYARPGQRLFRKWCHVDAFWTCMLENCADGVSTIISGATRSGSRVVSLEARTNPHRAAAA